MTHASCEAKTGKAVGGVRRGLRPAAIFRSSFYTAPNRLLAENDFDSFVKALCGQHDGGSVRRPLLPPGVVFRITFIGYFEGLPSHRTVTCRRADSRSLAAFLGLGPEEENFDHSSISKTHKRLPKEVFDEFFRFVLLVAARTSLLWGEKFGIQSMTILTNTSMRTIVRKNSGNGWNDYTKKLATTRGSTIRQLRCSGNSTQNGPERSLER